MQFKTAYNVFKIVLVVILVEISVVNCVSEEELFAFGEDVDDNYMASGDETFAEVDLPSIFYYLDDEQESLVVHSNGFVSFAAPIPGFREDLKIPFYHPYIAPFYADVDTTVSGRVYHRKTRDANLLEKATTYIRKAFPYHQFQLEWLFIATWSGVGHYKGASDQVNTFQTVLASGGEKSYVLILYPTAGISWFQMEGRHSGEMVLAQAGLDAGSNNQYYLLPGQGTPDIRYLDR
ncbi:hypothetical protein HELRODRAFT_167758 [Helobdella robusta]|uniref:NIDO domain-containing protein n=1 Tax=Helobdella robusta TaxID=6412 RepID=T1EZR8_HELRO|nr:hypothetical protein HELRODRAFT_167758 [Helobdella robusta]ESO09933.1 hypothetical protein HELRODRAFT_167758 [Helobdella robusta]